MLMRWFLALLLLTGVAFAQSQPPPTERNQPADSAAQPAASDQRGTDQVPLTVKILPAPKPKADSDKEERERKEKSEIDRKLAFETQRIADYTDRLVLFTVFLFCVAFVQAGLFVWQLILIKRTLGPAQEAAEAAKESAEALVAAEGARLLIFPHQHNCWDAATKFGTMYSNSPEMGSLSQNIVCWIAFKNYGKTPAIMKEASVRLERSDTPPETMPQSGFAPMIDLPLERVIVSGKETDEVSCRLDETLDMTAAIAIAKHEQSIWLLGYVTYDDVFERECTQRFLYKLDPVNSDGFIRYYDKSTYRKT